MTKTGIITFHFVNNYGGALQTFALQKYIAEEFGHDVRVIDYRNRFIQFTDFVRLFPVTPNSNEIAAGIRTMTSRLRRLKRFDQFVKEHIGLTRRYESIGALKKDPPVFDHYICGSDQIWNPTITLKPDPAYFLSFIGDPAKKTAYAPSFGNAGIPGRTRAEVRKLINRIGYVSVREESGQKLIRKITGKAVEKLIDPTFLIDREEWDKIAVMPQSVRPDEPYILLYIMQQDDEVYEYARRLKEQLGIKMVEISRYGYNPGFVDETVIDAGPGEFLGLFKNAACVCTNSYHGLAYSVIYEKDCCLVPCKRFTARIDNLLNLLGIDAHKDSKEERAMMLSYDRDAVRKIIGKERERSRRFLQRALHA